jgi:hypothetical protein
MFNPEFQIRSFNSALITKTNATYRLKQVKNKNSFIEKTSIIHAELDVVNYT